MDGNFKLEFRVCMFQVCVQISVHVCDMHKTISLLFSQVVQETAFANKLNKNCESEPVPGKAFCVEHCKVMTDRGYKIAPREFLQQVGVSDVKKFLKTVFYSNCT